MATAPAASATSAPKRQPIWLWEGKTKVGEIKKGEMVSPSIVLVVAVGVTVVLLLFVTPTFEKMFKDFGGAMPAPTQFVIDMSQFMQKYILWMIAGLIAAAIAFRQYLKWPKGRE